MKEEPESFVYYPTNMGWLMKTYFSDPEKRIKLKKGDCLIHEGEPNERLFLIVKGVLKGSTRTPDGGTLEAFKATRNRFVGGPSFFSRSFTSLTTVIADEDSEVAYIEQNQEVISDGQTNSIEEQFMPVMVTELVHRQNRIQKIGLEKEKALKALIHSEKLATLGQISAGIAHELNNAVAVVKRNSDWISQAIAGLMRDTYPNQAPYFDSGINEGRRISTREVRKRAKELNEHFSISRETALKIAQTGISDEKLKRINDWRDTDIEKMTSFWEIGATLNDMLVAANHAVHVVQSIKNLGAQRSERKPGLDINECINEAVTLLTSPLRKITLETVLEPLPLIIGNKGEIVQVIINILQNACESMLSAGTPNSLVSIRTRYGNNRIQIDIEDNGPGIPSNILHRIFEPAITTKTGGKTIGLGLGLTIVERLVDSYGGKIKAKSKPGKTVFTIQLPSGVDYAKT